MNNIYYNTGHHIIKPHRPNEYSTNTSNKNIQSLSVLNFPLNKYSNANYKYSYTSTYNLANKSNHENSKDIAPTRSNTNLSYSAAKDSKIVNRFTFAQKHLDTSSQSRLTFG